ncbi:hypothetical protein Tco_1223768 [Tanacetum coccineum]
MSFGSHSVGDPVVPKFDMHTYTSVLTVNKVNSLAEEYAIPLDLRPRVPPSTLTMNKLPADKIVATNMSQFLKFPMAGGVRIGKGPALKENEIIVQHTTPPLPSRTSILEKSDHQKSGSDTHYFASSLTTVIPDNVIVGAGGGNQILRDVEHEEEETGNDSNPDVNDVNEEGEINSPHSASSPHSVHSTHSDRSLHFEDQHNVRSGDYDLH